MKTYDISVDYSGYYSYQIDAENEEEAHEEAFHYTHAALGRLGLDGNPEILEVVTLDVQESA